MTLKSHWNLEPRSDAISRPDDPKPLGFFVWVRKCAKPVADGGPSQDSRVAPYSPPSRRFARSAAPFGRPGQRLRAARCFASRAMGGRGLRRGLEAPGFGGVHTVPSRAQRAGSFRAIGIATQQGGTAEACSAGVSLARRWGWTGDAAECKLGAPHAASSRCSHACRRLRSPLKSRCRSS
jgi:hypothetical protein